LTILLIRHLNKARRGPAVLRGSGSVAISGQARAVLLAAKDPADPERRILAMAKTNLGSLPASLRFGLAEGRSTVGVCGRVEWLGESELTADDLLYPPEGPEPEADAGAAGAYLGARAFLERFVGRPADGAEVVEAAAEGLAPGTLKAARASWGWFGAGETGHVLGTPQEKEEKERERRKAMHELHDESRRAERRRKKRKEKGTEGKDVTTRGTGRSGSGASRFGITCAPEAQAMPFTPRVRHSLFLGGSTIRNCGGAVVDPGAGPDVSPDSGKGRASKPHDSRSNPHLGRPRTVGYGRELTLEEAAARRRHGQDIVVRGPNLEANRELARSVEALVGPPSRPQLPHKTIGSRALPISTSCPEPGRPLFSETAKVKAKGYELLHPDLILRAGSPMQRSPTRPRRSGTGSATNT
jgi:hypothetical protein